MNTPPQPAARKQTTRYHARYYLGNEGGEHQRCAINGPPREFASQATEDIRLWRALFEQAGAEYEMEIIITQEAVFPMPDPRHHEIQIEALRSIIRDNLGVSDDKIDSDVQSRAEALFQ